MANSNNELRSQIAKTGNVSAPVAFENNMRQWFVANSKKMATMIGSKQEANKLMIALLHVAQKNPRIMSCSMSSISDCLMQSASLGLYPGAMQQCAYVPYGQTLTFIPQYQGLSTLAYRSGFVESISTGVVKEGDSFWYRLGCNPDLEQTLGEERGKILCAWCVIKLKNGDPLIEVMNYEGKDSLMSIKKRSPAAKRSGSPWDTDEEEMCRKTVMKRALKAIPKTPELAQAVEIDNAQDRPDLAKKIVVPLDESNVVMEEKENDADKISQSNSDTSK